MSLSDKYGNNFLKKESVNGSNNWQPPNEKPKQSMFRYKTAQEWLEWASKLPPLKKLWGDLWYENELCILFSETNVGKTVLTVQIADAISRGINMYPLTTEVPAQKILYIDFEMNERQFYKRYSTQNGWKDFSPNFIRADVVAASRKNMPPSYKSYAKYTIDQIKMLMSEVGAKSIFIDNLTAICKNMEKGTEAVELMDELNDIKKEFEAAILVVGHTPKRDSSKILEKANLAGSANLANFCDSMIGISKGSNNERYVKQLKTRGSDFIYDARNVLVFDLHKDDAYLEFEFGAYASENQLLTADWINQEEVMQMFKAGKSMYEIAQVYNTYQNKIKRIIKKEEQKREREEKERVEFQSFADNSITDQSVPF